MLRQGKNLIGIVFSYCRHRKFFLYTILRGNYLNRIIMDKVRTLCVAALKPLMDVTRGCCDSGILRLVKFPQVNIGSGKMKYILAKVYVHGESGGAKTVLRAVSRVKYHLDVYDQLQKEAHNENLCTECLGGGIMVHDTEKRYIKIYGRSHSLGKADHHEAREILHDHDDYSAYKIDAESGKMDI